MAISGILTDAEGNKVAVGTYRLKKTDKSKGPMRATLDFEGKFIRQSGKDGPYYLKRISVFDEFKRATVLLHNEQSVYTTTGKYNHAQFQ
jgi:hypothetical protein